MTLWWDITGITLALIGLALVNLIATALVGVTAARLRQLSEQGDGRAETVQRLSLRPPELVIEWLIDRDSAGVAGCQPDDSAGVAGWALAGALDEPGSCCWSCSVRGDAAKNPGCGICRAACLDARCTWLAALDWLLTPALVVLCAISLALLRLFTASACFRAGAEAAPMAYSEEDIKDLVTAGEQSGEVEASEREMIHGVIEFAESSAHEVMVPRTDLVALPSRRHAGRGDSDVYGLRTLAPAGVWRECR